MDSFYDDRAIVKDHVLRGRHRELIGGLWDEIGQLQLDFLVANGLRREHRLLDVGCGALRGGVRFIAYLDPGNYWGLDSNDLLLDVGFDIELRRARLQARQPRGQLLCSPDFDVSAIDVMLDYVLAQSVFTHLSLGTIRRCLTRIAPAMASGATFFATFFELGEDEDRAVPKVHPPAGVTSHGDRSFYHHSMEDLRGAADALPLEVRHIGDWGHPRGQRMIAFVKA